MSFTTTLRSFALVHLALFAIAPLQAAMPAELTGHFVDLGDNRLEFGDEFTGVDGEEPIDYSYEILDGLTAELVVEYSSSSRRRDITLSFLADGTPNGYQEFDFLSTDPPFPPAFRSGLFTIGELDVEPPADSSAPESLVGQFLNIGGKRLEFLTPDSGRCFFPGKSEYFVYEYGIEADSSALVEIFYDDGIRELTVSLVFHAVGIPVSFTSTERNDGIAAGEKAGVFSMGTNLHLADLKIGFGNADLRGDDLYHPAGKRQTISKRSTSSATLIFPFAIENDGNDDAFRLRATPARGTFKVRYFSDPGRKNLTAAMTTGRYTTHVLGHLEEASFEMAVKPLRQRGSYRGRVEARSLAFEAARDRIDAHALVKAKKHKAPGKGGGKPSGKK